MGEEYVSDDALDRVVHARGKSLRDLVRQRRGDLGRVPDVVVRPGDEAEVDRDPARGARGRRGRDPVRRRHEHLRQPRGAARGDAHGHLGRPRAAWTSVLEIDATSRLARVQAGVYGPRLEEQLNAQGWTFGHYPDSFTHSTLGGWIATRSSGMQSDRYGDIADSTRGLRVVTPGRAARHRARCRAPRPARACARWCSAARGGSGSSARRPSTCAALPAGAHDPRLPVPDLGRVGRRHARHRGQRGRAVGHARGRRRRDGVLVRDQEGLVAARQGCSRRRSRRSSTRRKGFDLEQMCLGFIGYEGSERHVKRAAQGGRADRRRTTAALCIGSSPGELYDQKKFDTPYIRDYLLDRGVLADVSETAAPWSALQPASTTRSTAAARGAFAELGVRGYIMCHLSHSYHAGACLYFTFAFTPSGRRDGLEEYGVVKSAIQQAFVDNGGTLSHHHAVGTEHAEWLEQDISAPGVGMLRGAVRRHRPRREPQPGEDRVTRPARSSTRPGRAAAPARARSREAVLMGVLSAR